jgi:ubiquinone/menaquinone biosynthesis C-methylase UbiE
VRASLRLPENYFGEDIAAGYDEETADMPVDPVVDFLAERARGGPVLELAIGTGRIALPLAARGLRVHGIDLSGAMVAKLREKPGGEEIAVTIGDYATTRVDGRFTVA